MNTREIAKEYRLSHWAGIIQDRQESGLSVKTYCENAGIHTNNYFYWQRKLREAACEELGVVRGNSAILSPQGFMEVKLPNRTALSPATDIDSHLYIEAVGLRITAGGNYPLDKLVAVLREVSRSC
jgi:hypothetical protein